ncbi:MAG: 50S ribosomal protein L35 [Betaproteobacteria bacterium AqS2]|uniref:Large ribosomal subunit protein bL35 n=1 Tax=Candidatus Amphirhobacter heronislandensis TaxID=1732024 RepID=A0A930UFN4_9GAMM|nr:50S ribosomal protein L35 [Betaproteobacteria bacterium AqS2]
MPKMKTNRAAAKRFRSNGKGALRHGRSNKRHMLTHKSARRRRQLRGNARAGAADLGRLRGMLPYSG